ncbi:MAG: IclR family transcriptional regulator [Betaproteobacteria bacterium]|nr:IclR family transcriptional regulator [Betaproteobacteria bacterium]
MAKKSESSSATLRAFLILEHIVGADRPVSMTEVMDRVGLPKPTVYRILTLLEAAGLLVREPDGKSYTVGPRLARFGLAVMMNGTVRAQRHAILQRLVDEVGETCNLTMQDGGEVVYLDRVDSPWPLRIDLKPGSRVPLHASASGKLFLARLPRGRRRALLANLALTRFTDNTITDAGLLEAELDRVRNHQVAVDNEEYLAGLVCVAVPVLGRDERVLASLAVQAPVARLSVTRAMDHVPALRRAAQAMAATFDQPETGTGMAGPAGAREAKPSESRRRRADPASA